MSRRIHPPPVPAGLDGLDSTTRWGPWGPTTSAYSSSGVTRSADDVRFDAEPLEEEPWGDDVGRGRALVFGSRRDDQGGFCRRGGCPGEESGCFRATAWPQVGAGACMRGVLEGRVCVYGCTGRTIRSIRGLKPPGQGVCATAADCSPLYNSRIPLVRLFVGVRMGLISTSIGRVS